MKRLYVLLLGAMIISAAHAQVVQNGESALVYYSPKTDVTITFTYRVESQEPGLYARYAKQLLGIEDAVTENRTTYHLTKAAIGTVTSADYSRPHKVVADGAFPMLLTVNEKGILKG